VRLKVNNATSEKLTAIIFQFLLVRLKAYLYIKMADAEKPISIPSGAIKSVKWCYLQIAIFVISIPSGAIKSSTPRPEVLPSVRFQFLLVRLKAIALTLLITLITFISIPSGAIKSKRAENKKNK